MVSIFFFFLGFTRSFYTQSLCNISATELAMAWVALLVLGDLVCMQRKAQLFAPNRGGQLVSGFGFHSSVHQDWAVANILMTAGLLHSEPPAPEDTTCWGALLRPANVAGNCTPGFTLGALLGSCCTSHPGPLDRRANSFPVTRAQAKATSRTSSARRAKSSCPSQRTGCVLSFPAPITTPSP